MSEISKSCITKVIIFMTAVDISRDDFAEK